jgi:Ni/Co efflux regulator RcnB
MLKYLVCAMLALSLSAGPAFAQDTTSGTQETSGTKKHHKKKDKDKANKADAGAAKTGDVAVNNTVCPVSGQSVSSMGKPTTVTYKGQTVNLCCAACKDKFMANADANLEKAKANANAKQ